MQFVSAKDGAEKGEKRRKRKKVAGNARIAGEMILKI